MMIMIWTLILSPSDTVFDAVASVFVWQDVHYLSEFINLYRLHLLKLGMKGSVHVEGLCHHLMPYGRCQWHGLHPGSLQFYPNTARFSPGSLTITLWGQCHKLVFSSYGLVRHILCDY